MRKDVMFADCIGDLPDYLNARDISRRLSELEIEKAEYRASLVPNPEANENADGVARAPESATTATATAPEWDEDKETLLVVLRELDEAGCDQWVSDDEWQSYCKELAYDTGMIAKNSTMANYVDWERWADDCAMDYTEVGVGGITFYGR